MTDVYVALKRLKRKGKPARILQGNRAVPTFDQTWAKVDGLATMFPDRVRRGVHGADR